jgi:mannose-6-phosphate isomerase-like protein (cupin superfamily)
MASPQLREFLDALTELTSVQVRHPTPSSRDLERFLELLSTVSPNPALRRPGRLAVCRHWDPALSSAEAAGLKGMADVLRSLEPLLPWQQNPNYAVDRMGAAFLENYGYFEIIGAGGLWCGDLISAGVLLLGPQTHYPPHAHPAVEHYCVLSGDASWGLGDGPLLSRPPGSVIYHPSGVPHQTLSGDAPLLVLYLWQGDVHVAANLTAPT